MATAHGARRKVFVLNDWTPADGVPNLDTWTSDDLMAFWARYRRGTPRAEAAQMLGGCAPGYTGVVSELACYASNKATAMTCRLSGDVRAATNYEAYAERIYNGLPDDAKW